MEEFYSDVTRKDTTHGRYLELLSAFEDEAGISLKSNKQEVLDHLEVLIREVLPKIRMKECKILREIPDVEGIAYKLGSYLNFSITNSISLTKTADLLGKAVLMGFEPVTQSQRVRNITRVKIGVELLDLLRLDKKIVFRREAKRDVPKKLAKDVKVDKKKNRSPYKIKVTDERFALKLGLAFYYPDKDRPIYTQPLLRMPPKWKHFFNPVMGEMVRNCVEGAEREFTIEKAPKVYAFMNKIRKTSFQVNEPLLWYYEQCVDDPIFTQSEKDFKPVQLASILQQQREILRIADSVRYEPQFWLASFLDFRGRFYYANTYFHPQGNKVARSLFLFSGEGIAIGKKGWNAAMAAAASENGQDKLSFEGKVKYAEDHLNCWMECATDPIACKNTWQTAENPFGFLSIILEIYNACISEDRYEYKSAHPIFIDASNSGTQILSALGRDPVGGKLSNLLTSAERGDVYLFIANKIWPGFEYTEQEEKLFGDINNQITTFQWEMDCAFEAKEWEALGIIRTEYSDFYEANKEAIKAGAKVFWKKLEGKKRKLCKRPVMTIPYSVGVRTMSRTLYKDWRPEPEMKGITSTYCFELSQVIVDTYASSLKIPADLMNLFIELGLRAYKNKKDLSFRVPHTGFFFAQNARKDKLEQIELDRRGQRLGLVVCVGQDGKIDYDSVKSASSANTIHSLDAALMMMIVMASDYPMMAVHDSFATYPGAYEKLHKNVREQFVKAFKDDILLEILTKCNSEDLRKTIKYGTLDINGVLTNEYAFSV